MFAAKAKAIVKNLGAERDLIYNESLNEKIEILTLVKINNNKIKGVMKYTFMDLTLFDLIQNDGTNPADDVSTRGLTVLENVSSSTRGRLANEVKRGSRLKADKEKEDKATSFTVKTDKVDLSKLRTKYNNRAIRPNLTSKIQDWDITKVAFVYQTIYNESSVTLSSKASGSLNLNANISPMGHEKEETRFTVPGGSTFAFGLMKIKIDDDELIIPLRTRKLKHYDYGRQTLGDTKRQYFIHDAEEQDNKGEQKTDDKKTSRNMICVVS